MFRLSHKFTWIRKLASGRSRGATLIEVVIAIVVLGFVVASIPTAMIVVHKMQAQQDERRVAEYLTRSELEYIKNQPYIWGNVTGYKGYPPLYDLVHFTENYFLKVVAIPIDKATYQPLDIKSRSCDHDPEESCPYVEDQGIQEITISVYTSRNPGEMAPVLVTTNYKVALGEE